MFSTTKKPHLRTDTEAHLRTLPTDPVTVHGTVIECSASLGICFVQTDSGFHVGFVKAKTDVQVWQQLAQGVQVSFTYAPRAGGSDLRIKETRHEHHQ